MIIWRGPAWPLSNMAPRRNCPRIVSRKAPSNAGNWWLSLTGSLASRLANSSISDDTSHDATADDVKTFNCDGGLLKVARRNRFRPAVLPPQAAPAFVLKLDH